MRSRSQSSTRIQAALAMLTLGLRVGGTRPVQAQSTTSNATLASVPRLRHVFLIIGENTDYEHLTPTNAPYLLGTIRPNGVWFTQYYGATHWSEANYVALVSGQYTDCEQSDDGIACHQNVDNIFHQLDAAGLTWKTWLEGGTAKCDTGSGSRCSSNTACPLTGFYTTGNPAILFDDIEGPNGIWSATNPSLECLRDDVPAGDDTDPMGNFNTALAIGNVANFNLIIPNGCDDGERNCAPVNNRYTQFDNFLAREVPLIQASPAYRRNDVIIVVYDEDERAGGLSDVGLGQGGHTACALLSPIAIPGSYDVAAYHYTLLRTLEDGFGISNYLGSASVVTSLDTIWTR
jgi:hypothetical protein